MPKTKQKFVVSRKKESPFEIEGQGVQRFE